jgi:4-amino-4-deoxy-L-arabinose transferase-like glycosyltransferase
MTIRNLFILTVIILFLKQAVWTAIVPIFQTPDEQAHFAQIQWVVEKDNKELHLGANRSSELVFAEENLGVFRDSRGNNSFTYHPEFNIAYSKTTTGTHETEINNLPKALRTTYVGAEAAGYPPLYYLVSQPLYRIFGSAGLIDRLFSLRLSSLIFIVFLGVISWKIGQEVFSSRKAALALCIMVNFQPMISFVGAGYHPDNLLNVLVSLVILCSVLLIKKGFKWKYLFAIGILISLGLETKQFMFFVIPSALALCAMAFFKNKVVRILAAAAILIFPVVAFVFLLPIPNMPHVTPASPLFSMNFLEYLKFRLPRLLFEMHPWYWGVFKWLGLTLNPTVMKIITRIVGLAGVGLIIGLVFRLIKRRFELTEKIIVFFLISTASYILYMFLWDWRLMQASGFSLGLQGRYLLPLIVAHMALLLFGVTNLLSEKIKSIALFLISLGMMTLNLAALLTVIKSYYSTSSFETFIIQASQYKPAIFKGDNLKFLIFSTGLLMVIYFFLMFKGMVLDKDDKKSTNRQEGN